MQTDAERLALELIAARKITDEAERIKAVDLVLYQIGRRGVSRTAVDDLVILARAPTKIRAGWVDLQKAFVDALEADSVPTDPDA